MYNGWQVVMAMHISEMTINDEPPFGETTPAGYGQVELHFNFDQCINLFAGPNSSGKSTILRILSEFPRQRTPVLSLHVGWASIDVSDDWPKGDRGRPDLARIPYVQIGATRLGLPRIKLGEDDLPAMPYKEGQTLEHIFGHGYDVDTFDATNVELAVELLTEKARLRPGWELANSYIYFRGPDSEVDLTNAGGSAGANLRKAIVLSFQCVKKICPEIIQGPIPTNWVEGVDVERDMSPTMPTVRTAMAIDTIDAHGLDANSLSSGTQSSLLWIRFLALNMLYHYDFTDGWEKQPAILLIDEIENHLHPTWQRRVIPALLDHFPGLQIFATTHSPFVVAGLKAGQVHLLNRDASGVVTASTNTEDIVGWTADEILRTMMGVQDPTDDETARNAAALRQLRDEGPRATPEEEEQRQAEMQRLRRLVNRDLLAGGPREAQRELFEQQFGEALEKYLQSQDLNQDNG